MLNLFRRLTAPAVSRPRLPFRPSLEVLEGRSVPATFTVTNLNDAGAGSLRQAIIDANADAVADDIVFQSGLTGTITLSTGRLSITEAVNIQGPGAADLTVSGNNSSQVFLIDTTTNGALVTMSGLTLTGGQGGSGGAIELENGALTMTDCVLTGNTSGNDGGGIYQRNNGDALTLINCTISGNTANDDGGGLALYGLSATIINSTISGNSSGDRAGGIEANFDNGNQSLVIRNSTISGNTAGNRGGGIYLYGTTATSSVLIENSTIAFNQALNIGGGIFVTGNNNANLTLRNTIVSNNTDLNGPNDLRRQTGTVNAEYSLIQNQFAGAINGTDTNNLVGVDPGLSPLAPNGGPTQTHALTSSSPAFNAGDPAFTPPPGTDQRGPGFDRVAFGRLDIGAFEVQVTPLPPAAPSVLAVAAGAGSQGHVKAFNAAGTEVASFLAYPGFTGPVRTAHADVNHDGVADLITGTAQFADHVKVFDGRTGGLLFSFLAFGGYIGGIDVAGGDINNDGFADIIVGAGPGAPGGHVKVFDGQTGALTRSFFAFDGYVGGVNVGAGDLDNDGNDDILVSSATGASHVKGFSSQTGALLASFFAFSPQLPGGIDVAGGDTNGDGFSEIFTATGPGVPAAVRVFSAAGVEQLSFSPYGGFTGGVRVGSVDLNGDNRDEIVTGAGPGAGPHVKRFDGQTAAEIDSFFAFIPGFTGGVDVG